VKAWLKAPLFSPAGFLVRAGALAVVYALLSIFGLRDFMSVLSLTFPEGVSRHVSLFIGLIYLLSYFSFILGVPILVIAAGLLALARPVIQRGMASWRPPSTVRTPPVV